MKINLNGTFDVAASPTETYLFLTDPQRFAPLLPMFKELKDVQVDEFSIVLDVGMPQIRGKAEARVKFVERINNQRASFSSAVRHSLGMADSQMGFDLSEVEGGSRIAWTCDTTVRGTLASVAAGILAPLAKRNIAAMIASIQKELGPISSQTAQARAEAPIPSDPSTSAWAKFQQWLRRLFSGKGAVL
jgi:carbon monoxide dehydrogenase subunit G